MAQKRFTQCYIAQGNGDFVQAQSFTVNLTNNAKQIHTLRVKGAGFTLGTEETTIGIELVIPDDDGPEREFHEMVQLGTPVQLRVKIPGGQVFTYNGVYQSADLTAALDDATKLSLKFIGKMDRPSPA